LLACSSATDRGVGSILGAAFLLLILITGFAIYAVHTGELGDYAEVLREMTEMDGRRNKENIEIMAIETTAVDGINISVRNQGPVQAHLIYIGVFDTGPSNTQKYYKVDYYVDPAETLTNVMDPAITIAQGQERVVQLVTDLGNTVASKYPTPIEEPSGASIYDFVDEASDFMAKGSHSFFAGQQAGPDGIVDSMTEVNTGQGSFTEVWSDTFNPAAEHSWQTQDLSAYDVPANSIAVIHIYQDSDDTVLDAGVRAVGSTLDRYIPMHEAEAGGLVVSSMMVQLDSSAHIEIYAESIADDTISFRVIGFFTGFTYAELFDHWNPDYGETWTDKDLFTDYGVPKGRVVELFLANSATNRERPVGVRRDGSSLDRYLLIHEAESGGLDGFTTCIKTDEASGLIECYNYDDSGHFYLLGYFDDSMDYVEGFNALSTSSYDVWEDQVLPTPANVVAEIFVGNGRSNAERSAGVRSDSSSMDRRVLLHEAEGGGVTGGRWTAQANSASVVEIYRDESQIAVYMLGYWAVGANYELSLEVRWTEVDYDETNEWLSIYAGDMGNEDLQVDVWSGGGWVPLVGKVEEGWNSIDVSSYLVSPVFRIRYRGAAEASDVFQNSWEVDSAFLYTWT
jgi:hypothetical protein